ncbi:MAG TPA: TetR/AcrR family transcriptional regulator [Candidatus Anaerotignum merdipullorum]|nr:TetR/AcrR family transcriptional regulator [Candidatus Anaerotignum merdipullorum]
MKTEQHILQTAFRLFLGKGFSDISTNEIIREAGTTKGGFYYCFKSREDLVNQVIETYLLPYYLQPITVMHQAWENKRADVSTKTLLWEAFFAPQRFRQYQEFVGMDIAFRDFYFLLYEGMKKYEEVQRYFAENTKEREICLRRILERGKERKEIAAEVDIDSCVMMTLAMQDGILALKVLDDSIDDEEKYRRMEEQIWRDIAAQDAYLKYLHGGVNSAVS